MRRKKTGQGKKYEEEATSLVAKIDADTEGRFDKDKQVFIDSAESYDTEVTQKIFEISEKLKNAKHFGRLLTHLTTDEKGDAGKEIARSVIQNYLELDKAQQNQEILDRCLMMAAKLGDAKLYNETYNQGGRFARNNELIVDEKNFNVLHYACQSEVAPLVHQIAEEMRLAESKGEFTAPPDSKVNKRFDPFRIRDDKSGTQSYTQINELRPIHYISYSLARQLDKQYGLPDDGSPGTFVSAYSLFRIENRVLAKSNIDWAKQKKNSFGDEGQKIALEGKFFGGVPVANTAVTIGSPTDSMVATNIAAAGLITGVALVFAGYQGIQHKRHKKLAIDAMSAYEFVSLPDLKTREIIPPQGNYIDRKRFQLRDVLRGSNHDMMEALKIRDYKKIMELAQDPESFKTTTPEMIQAVQRLDFNPTTNPKIEEMPFLKQRIYKIMLDNRLDKGNYQSNDTVPTLNALFDTLYRTETITDNDLAQELIRWVKQKNISDKNIQQAIAKWSSDLIDQEILLSDAEHFVKEKPAKPPRNDKLFDAEEKTDTLPGNDNLIDALENYDYYKVRHILAHGEFNYTSKEIMHTIESRFVIPTDLPIKTDLKGDASEKPFLTFLFESLAKKAGPKQFMSVLSHLINTRGQVETGKEILATLTERYNRDDTRKLNADRERLIVCALLAAGLGDKKSLHRALDGLQNRHYLSTLEIMDENGNNILHYAAKSQDSDMIKYIMQNTSLIHDFNLANKKVAAKPTEGIMTEIRDWGKYKLASENERMINERKFHDAPEERETLTSIKKAETIFEIPNRDGITPFRLLSNKETVARLDEFVGGTVGFRQDANEYRQNERNRKEDRAATVAQAGIIIAMLGASCGAIIPGAIGIGTALGTLITTKVGLASFLPGFTIMGGVTEGTTAVGIFLGMEHGLMPAFGKLGTALYRQWDKAFNGTSMESLADYDDRILTMSDQITTRIANSLVESGATKYNEVMDLIAQETKAFVDAESDPTMKELARLAAVNAAMRFTPVKDAVNPNNLKSLASTTRTMIFEAAKKIDKMVNISSVRITFKNTINEIKEEIEALKKERAVIHKAQKINQKIDRLYDVLERIKQDYASTSDVLAMQKTNHDMNMDMDKAFREAAIQKANDDLNRQIAVIDNSALSEDDKLAKKYLANTVHDEKVVFIEEIYKAQDDAYKLRADNYEHAYKNSSAKKMIFEEFRERLADIEGGTLQRGPLTQAADKIFKNPKDYPHPDDMAAALDAAYQHIRHPQPEKAIQMRRALNLFIDRQHYLEDAKKIDLTQILMKEADTASNLNQIKSLNTHLEKHTLAQSNIADQDPGIRKELKAEWDNKLQPLLDQITQRRDKLLIVATQLESVRGANRDDTNKIEKKLMQLADALKDCNKVITNLDRIGDNINSNRLQGQQVALTADIIIPINRNDPKFQSHDDFHQALEEARKLYVGKVPQAASRLGPLNSIPVDLSSQGAVMVIHQKSPAKTNTNPIDTVATLERNPSSEELAITVNQIDQRIKPLELVETAILLIETYVNQHHKKAIPITGSNVALTNAMKTYCDAMKNLMKDPKEKLRYTREPDTDLTRAEKQAHERAVSNMETYIKKTPQNMEKVNARNAQANSKPGFFSRSKQDNVEKFITKIRPGNR